MPNPWNVGSAVLLAGLGFQAVATTSSGFASSLGRTDQNISRADLIVHVADVAAAVAVPVSVDAEDCFPREAGGVEETVGQLLDAGAAGFSIEDYDPVTKTILDSGEAADRVGLVCDVARGSNCVVTARAENHLRDNPNLDDTIARLNLYAEAGADCLYAPGINDLEALERIVNEISQPVNVLLSRTGPTIGQLRDIGVRRVSTGGTLAKTALSAMVSGARELLRQGSSSYAENDLTWPALGELFESGTALSLKAESESGA